MSARRRSIIATALLAPLALPTLAHAKDNADLQAIRQTLQRYEHALNASDSAAIVRLFTDDGVLLAPDAPAAVGQSALRAAYEGTFTAIALKLSFTVDELKPLGQGTALLRSHSAGTLKGQGSALPAGPAAFKELFLLRKQSDGQWKFSHYSFSSAAAAR